jgi:2-polyprenyl-6-methoxyphenol hydroxylase-like FAD-dependent oxidoreductase
MAFGEKSYDAVIVGARCAGSPVALRLAQNGWRVLLVDRDPPPADTISTHFVFPNTLARLQELGVLERIRARHRVNPLLYRARILGHEVAGPFTPVEGFDRACGLTRPVLDLALLEAAEDAGAETLFGERVTGLLGTGSEDDPVRGVALENGDEIPARWVFGADGRASTVARLLGLDKRRPMAGEFGILFAYWRGLPPTEYMHIDARETLVLTWGPCEDDVHLLALSGPPEITRASAEERQRRFREGLGTFPYTLDPSSLEGAEQISDVRVAPETMMRGFFRQAAGPGWALVGDAGHFKHPATAQGISDAVEQAIHVADALIGADQNLEGYESWRDARAEEHYEFSFNFGRFPRPELAGPLFTGLEGDPDAAQDFIDSMSRRVAPRSGVFTPERMARWFAAEEAGQKTAST